MEQAVRELLDAADEPTHAEVNLRKYSLHKPLIHSGLRKIKPEFGKMWEKIIDSRNLYSTKDSQ